MEATECGAAALAIVLAHHRRHVPLAELRLVCGVSRDGSNAANILKAARHYGLEAKGIQTEADALTRAEAPAILFWKFEHFVVWEGNGRRFGRPVAFINDPACGRYAVSPEEFDADFTGVALTFEPGPGFCPGGRPPRLLADVRTRLHGTSGALLIGLVASLLLVLVGIATPTFTIAVVNAILLGADTSALRPFFGWMAVVVVATLGLTVLQQVSLLRTQLASSALGHARFLRHLLRLPVSFFGQRSPAEVTKRLETNGEVAQTVAKDLVGVLVNGVVIVVYAALMWAYDVRLALIGVGLALLNAVALRAVVRSRESAVAKLVADRGKFYEVSFDGLHLIETMKATGGESAYFQRWAGHQAATVNARQRLFTPSAVFATVAPTLAVVASALVLLVGGLRAVEGAVSIGVLVAFQTLITSFARPVDELTAVAARVQDMNADVARLKDVEDFPADAVFARPEPERIRRLGGRLEFDAVTFGYAPLAEPLLRDFSFSVGPGQQVALVGGSGSGKSTTIRLISGLHTPWAGEIRLDGQPHTAVSRGTLAASVAFVDQEICLFEGTVRDNVTLWDPSIPDDAVVAALRDAAVYDVVAGRPGGIHSPVDEHGRNFSGGQRQRLEIARALVRSPSVLVLDEATSALDAETEQVIEGNLRRRGCACVVIAHRLSTVRNSDEIIVLDRGRVVERGRHEELIGAAGPYADLVKGH